MKFRDFIPLSVKSKIAAHLTRCPAPNHQFLYKYCIFKVDRIGDFVLSLGAIRQIIDQCGSKNCVLLLSTVVKDLAENQFPNVKKIFVPAAGEALWKHAFTAYFGTRKEIASYRFEYLISLKYHYEVYHRIVCSWVNAQHKILSYSTSLSTTPTEDPILAELFEQTIPYPANHTSNQCLEIKAHVQILTTLFGEDYSFNDALPRLENICCTEKEYILFVPYGGESIRDFPQILWEELMDIAHEKGLPIKICVAPKDEKRAQATIQRHFYGIAVNVAVESYKNLNDMVKAIAEAKWVCSVETSIAHIATALDKKLIALLGGGHYGYFAPWQKSKRQRWLINEIDCFGCGWKCIRNEPVCMTKIPRHKLRDAVEDLLASR